MSIRFCDILKIYFNCHDPVEIARSVLIIITIITEI